MKNLKFKKGMAAALLLGTLVGCGTTDKEKPKDDEIVDKGIDGKKEENLKSDVLNSTDMTVEELEQINEELRNNSIVKGTDEDRELIYNATITSEKINIPASVQMEADLYVRYKYDLWELDTEGNTIGDMRPFYTLDNTSYYDVYRGKGADTFGFEDISTEEEIKIGYHILKLKDKVYKAQFSGFSISRAPKENYVVEDGKVYAEVFSEKGSKLRLVQDEAVKELVTSKSK